MEELNTVFRFAPRGITYKETFNLTTGTLYGIPKELFHIDLSIFKVTDENFNEFSPPFLGTMYEILYRFKDALAVINYSNVNVIIVTQEALVDYNLNDRRTVNSFTTGTVDKLFNFPVKYFGVEKPFAKTYEIPTPVEFLCEPITDIELKYNKLFRSKEHYEEINPDEFKIENYRDFVLAEDKSKIVVVNGVQTWID